MTKFIIEHLDPHLWKWCYVEYEHISEFVGKKNLIFTNIKKEKEKIKLSKLGKVYSKSIKEMNLKNMCILDPSAKVTLNSKDKFDYILLGGILGDYPRKKRTKKELTDKIRGSPARNLDKYQMSTNTAAYVALKIINGTPLKNIKFRRKLKVKVNDFEEIELPFSFVEENGELILPKNYIKLIKEKSR
jgi:ribosome biogenesis SPOUT family RNA methylase Rps3